MVLYDDNIQFGLPCKLIGKFEKKINLGDYMEEVCWYTTYRTSQFQLSFGVLNFGIKLLSNLDQFQIILNTSHFKCIS